MTLSPEQAARLIEVERAQIAHEIHDSVLPLLFAASASLSQLIEQSGGELGTEVTGRLAQANDWLVEAMQTGRRLLTEIYPPELHRTSWSSAAGDAIDRLLGDDAGRVEWQIDPTANEVSDDVAMAAYRIVVEAVRNAVAHGKAPQVVISGQRGGDVLTVMVHDNGSGFDPGQIPAERFGVRSMRGRAELVGGSLAIDTVLGGPTRIILTVPQPGEIQPK